MKYIASILFMLLLMSGHTFAQSRCSESIELSQQLFVSGDYTACIQLVQESLKNCDFSPAEKEEAYILLAKANIELDNLTEIDVNIKKILKNNPNFKAKGGIQTEDFYNHVRKFNVVPLFSLGLTAGAVLPQFNTTKVYSILDSVDYGSPYSGHMGFSLGGKLEVEPVKNLSLTLEVLYLSAAYDRTLKKAAGWDLAYTESLGYLELPLYVKKSFTLREKFFPYLSCGVGILQISTSYANLNLRFDAIDPATKLNENFKLVTYQLNQHTLRTTSGYEWMFGTGMAYKKNNFKFSLDARYTMGISNIINAQNRFGNAELIYLFNYIDNNVLLNKIQLGASVSYILKYTVKKREDAKF